MSDLTAVSLFAGIGGFDEALRRAGVHVAAAVEIDEGCRGTLRRHFPETKLFNDVTEVTGDSYEQPDLFLAGESSPEDGPAKTSAWRDAARAWVAHARDCSGTSCGWPTNCAHAGSFSRTSPVSCLPSALVRARTPAPEQAELFAADDGRSETESASSLPTSITPLRAVPARADAWAPTEGQWVPSSGRWSGSGMAFAGECWTLSTSESPSDAIASSLPDVLETGPHLSKYFLSPKAATGILRRAERRGRELPPHLGAALSQLSRAEDDAATA